MSTDPAKTTIALVTGANQGIGRATAIRLARDHGYTVIIGSRKAEAGEELASELRSQGYQASSVQLDLSSDESIANAVSSIDEKYGRLDVLINNAAILIDPWMPAVPKLPTRELFATTFGTNVTGTAVLTDALVPLLRKAHGGPHIVFLSTSMASLTNATNKDMPYYTLNTTAYDCSKAAVNMLALNYVRILEDVGVRVNVACPGLVKTGLTYYMDGTISTDESADYIVSLTTAEAEGENGAFTGKQGPIPW